MEQKDPQPEYAPPLEQESKKLKWDSALELKYTPAVENEPEKYESEKPKRLVI